MFNELCLYLDLLVFLVGTLLYGFLTRELVRRREVLAGNLPLRLLVLCLTFWYCAALLDELLTMLDVRGEALGAAAMALDLGRAFAWLLSLSLLVHTLERVLAREDPAHRGSWRRLLPLPAYLSLGLFAAPAAAFVRAGEPLLGPAVTEVYPRVVVHAAVTLGLAILLTARLARHMPDARLVGFLRMLCVLLAVLLVLLAAGGLFAPFSPQAAGFERFLRTLLLAGLLLPGGLFLFYVQRYNLLRLTLSHATLRHFFGLLLLVMVVMLAGPAVGMQHLELLRRLVAWGLLLALILGAVYSPLMELALRRSATLRSLLGKNLSPRELDRLMDRIQRLDLGESEALAHTAAELGRWLGAEASFLPPAAAEPATAAFWSHLAASDAHVVHRLDPPSAELARLLARRHLHAVFPLRVEGRLRGVLGLAASATGGGYADGEIEAVRLVMRQLAATLALRRLVERRVAEERRAGEQERLSLLGLVSASLAHEIKNPLSSMKALAQALREELAEDDPTSEGVADLDEIIAQIDRLAATSREILGVARPRPGERAELSALVGSALFLLRAEARKRGIELDAQLDEVGPVPGSAAQWQTIVFNLILNAVEHTPGGATVRVRLEGAAPGAVFETTNPGAPVDGSVFEPFVSDGGTGLGLPLVARRVRELGGTIDVSCDAGEVTFRVAAPNVPAPNAPAPEVA